jgi:beta-glucanase (GH16 family)
MKIKHFSRAWGVFPAVVLVCCIANVDGAGWRLVWSDEFNGTGLDEKNWHIITANPGWINHEQQRYTAGHDNPGSNIFVKNGNLLIEARKGNEITSGRIEGQGQKSFMHGRMEARVRMPVSKGMWAAFWMLGEGGGWPGCGEIDIMEGRGSLTNFTSGAFHCSNFLDSLWYTMDTTVNVHDDFHTYAIQWYSDSIQWFIDDDHFWTLKKSKYPAMPFDKNYYFIINLAVGGTIDGPTDATTMFPESLIVDYVRVSERDPNVETVEPRLPPRASAPPTISRVGTVYLVKLASSRTYSFELVSLTGRTVHFQKGHAGSFQIETGGLPAGLYALKIDGPSGFICRRILIE